MTKIDSAKITAEQLAELLAGLSPELKAKAKAALGVKAAKDNSAEKALIAEAHEDVRAYFDKKWGSKVVWGKVAAFNRERPLYRWALVAGEPVVWNKAQHGDKNKYEWQSPGGKGAKAPAELGTQAQRAKFRVKDAGPIQVHAAE
jgi:hypothetical protein